jgi:hypothetical protein
MRVGEAIDVEVVRKGEDVCSEIVEQRDMLALGQRGYAVTAEFGDNQPIAIAEKLDLRLPHGVVEGMAVDEKDGWAVAGVLKCGIDSVGELDTLQHGEFMLP